MTSTSRNYLWRVGHILNSVSEHFPSQPTQVTMNANSVSNLIGSGGGGGLNVNDGAGSKQLDSSSITLSTSNNNNICNTDDQSPLKDDLSLYNHSGFSLKTNQLYECNRNDSSSFSNAAVLHESIVSSVNFEKQPPDNLRKSNFFHFDLSFNDINGFIVTVDKAVFVGFLEDTEDEKKLKNGIRYRMVMRCSNGITKEETVVIRLVDSVSKKPISYDGQDKNPDMCRVLLTHEVMCSRCCENKSCGNRNETPSDPVIINSGKFIRLHMKCNQNCLKNAGNPRETRRFKVMVYSEFENGLLKPLICSENMFVHNNSKHGRRPGSSIDHIPTGPMDVKSPPSLAQIIPKEGRSSGYEEIAVIGENFFEGIKIAFGNQLSLKTEYVSSNVLKVITPPFIGERQVEVKCIYASHIFHRGKFPIFNYYSSPRNTDLDYHFERVWNLLPKSAQENERPSDEVILARVSDTFEFIYASNMSMYQQGAATTNGNTGILPNSASDMTQFASTGQIGSTPTYSFGGGAMYSTAANNAGANSSNSASFGQYNSNANYKSIKIRCKEDFAPQDLLQQHPLVESDLVGSNGSAPNLNTGNLFHGNNVFGAGAVPSTSYNGINMPTHNTNLTATANVNNSTTSNISNSTSSISTTIPHHLANSVNTNTVNTNPSTKYTSSNNPNLYVCQYGYPNYSTNVNYTTK